MNFINHNGLGSQIAAALRANVQADHATRLKNAAIWHQQHAEKATNVRDMARHAELADRLFILSHMVR